LPVRSERRRYLAFTVHSDQRLEHQGVSDAVKESVHTLYGLKGLVQADPVFVEFDEDSQQGILRCTHDHLREVRASLAYITHIYGTPTVIQVLRVSGTIKALRAKPEV
jgi:ribonuclease P/MRP protein subunit POP5